jgi:hypothetical protein
VYFLWTLLAPGIAIALGAAGAVEALKPSAIYAFDIGVILTGFGELVTKGTQLHRRMHAMLFSSYGMLAALFFGWIYSAGGAEFASSWWTVAGASLLTAVIVGGDIVVGITRDAYEEVKSWVK